MADENSDLDLIPKGVETPPAEQTAPPPPAAGGTQRIYLENAFTGNLQRHDLTVPSPPPNPRSWQERLFLDARKEWRLDGDLGFTFSDRLNLGAEKGQPVPDDENLFNDFREGYLDWRPAEGVYLDIGRINLKSGVALGNNPTDFFKTRAVVEPLSADPTVLREDRLGTLMVRGQYIWRGGSVIAAFAPKLYQPSAVDSDRNPPSIDPLFDRTNAENRFLLKSSIDIAEDFSPEVLVVRQGSETRFGTNLTESIGHNVVAYGEWAGGWRHSLIEEALLYGRRTGTIPADAPDPLATDHGKAFRNEAAIGLSYTTESRITFNLEYHYNQAGFSHQDWRDWFDAGHDGPSADTLWFIRGYAADQQAPLSRHSVFLRADWTDAFVPDLDLTGFVNIDLYDGSGLTQVTADYHLSDTWTVGGLATTTFGGRRTDFGSLPGAASLMVHLNRYF